MLTPQPETQEQGKKAQAELQSRQEGAERCCSNTGRLGCPQRPVHQAVRSPKGNAMWSGRDWVQTEETGTGEQGFWK